MGRTAKFLYTKNCLRVCFTKIAWIPGNWWWDCMGNEIKADEALKRLREGNQRFTSNLRALEPLFSHTRREELLSGQTPFAIILGCSERTWTPWSLASGPVR